MRFWKILTYSGNSSTPMPFIPVHSTDSQTSPSVVRGNVSPLSSQKCPVATLHFGREENKTHRSTVSIYMVGKVESPPYTTKIHHKRLSKSLFTMQLGLYDSQISHLDEWSLCK
jgi:hypothetical protein